MVYYISFLLLSLRSNNLSEEKVGMFASSLLPNKQEGLYRRKVWDSVLQAGWLWDQVPGSLLGRAGPHQPQAGRGSQAGNQLLRRLKLIILVSSTVGS